MEPSLRPTVVVEKTAAGFRRERAAEVLLSTGGSRRRMSSRSSFGGVGRRNGGHYKERRWRLLNLLVGVVDPANERVYKFVSGAMRQPLDEELVDRALGDLKTHVSCELTRS